LFSPLKTTLTGYSKTIFARFSVITAPALIVLGQAPAGIQVFKMLLDPRFHGDDECFKK
jgi:hypothetical protein